jgi:hypothetical protein
MYKSKKEILLSTVFSSKPELQNEQEKIDPSEVKEQEKSEIEYSDEEEEETTDTVSTEEEDLDSLGDETNSVSSEAPSNSSISPPSSSSSLTSPIIDYDLVERNEYLKKIKGLSPTCRSLFHELEVYYYLPHHDPLDYEMEFSLTPNEKIKVELCLYVISNSSTQDPYLAFVLENKEELFSFPFFDYTYIIPNNKYERKEEEEEEHSYETTLFNLVLNKIFSLFQIQMDMKNKKQMKYFLSWRKNSYKGHIWNESTKTLQIVLDVSYFLPFIKLTKYLLSATLPKESIQWSVLHEIVHLKKLRDIPISPSVASFFMEEKDALLLNIKNRFGASTYIPFMMYSCVWQETEFVTTEDSDTILPPLSKHPILGSMYFFSNSPLNGSTCPSRRYIVYPTKTIYMIKSLSLELFNTEVFYNSVYFQEKKQPIWGIQNASFFHEL